MTPIVRRPAYVHARLKIWRLYAAIIVAFALLTFLEAETLVASDSTSPQQRIQQLESFLQTHPGVFDWNVHNELRHLYITKTPPDLRKSMEHADLILQHSLMDDYILNILSEWELDKDKSKARVNLLMKAQLFPNLPFLAAACFLKIGDLYAMDGNVQMATSAYLKVADNTSYAMRRYQRLADHRIKALKEPPGRSTAAAMIGSYRGTASIEVQGTQRRIPVTLAIESERGEMFTGYLTIQAATPVKVPIRGQARQGDITASGSLPDRSLSISLRAKRTGKDITGRYSLNIPDYRQYQLSAPSSSGEFAVSR